jgi:hypothetical protein
MVMDNLETASDELDQDLDVEEAGTEETAEADGGTDGEVAPSLDTETRSELEKRFGSGKSDIEYTKLAYDYATNIERQDQRRSNEMKELNSLISKIGGLDVLKKLTENPDPMANIPNNVRAMIQAGQLDPEDPKDQLLIATFKELEGLKNKSVELDVRTAVDTFESGLQSKIASKYPDANIDTIRALAYAGAFKEVPDEEFWQYVERIAKNDQERITGIIGKRGTDKGGLIRRNASRSIVPGRRVATERLLSPKEAFDQEYDKYKSDDE